MKTNQSGHKYRDPQFYMKHEQLGREQEKG